MYPYQIFPIYIFPFLFVLFTLLQRVKNSKQVKIALSGLKLSPQFESKSSTKSSTEHHFNLAILTRWRHRRVRKSFLLGFLSIYTYFTDLCLLKFNLLVSQRKILYFNFVYVKNLRILKQISYLPKLNHFF